MLMIIPSVVLSTALLLALVLNLVLKPSFASRITTACLIISVLGGLFFYGAGYMELSGDLLLTVIRTPVFVLRMYLGVNEFSAIAGSAVVSTPIGVFCFWLVHLFAFYSITSAAMTTIGAEALRSLRFLLSRRGDLTLIYGINENSIALGKECVKANGHSVVFVAEDASAATVSDLNYAGMSVITGAAAVASDKKTLRTLHIKNRKLTVFALDEVSDKNLFYALDLKKALEQQNIPPENTRITLPGAEDIIISMLQLSPEHYGFGYVNVFDRSTLTARALVRMCPPWESIHFAPDGRAKEDYECVIVGFGSHGQAVLRQLIMNGQFAGATFHAAVFSPNFSNESGYLMADSPELMKNYDIQSFEADARSTEFYNYIASRITRLKLIAVCTGDEQMNQEISDNLMLFLQRRNAESVAVVRCGDRGVRYQQRIGSPVLSTNIYTLDFLSAEEADRNAILLNATYDSSERSNWEKWIACDSFGKMSSRASADFIPAFIRASGSRKEDVMSGNWKLSDEMLQNLGETEHMRWNAFHYAMGYSLMSREEFEANAATWAHCRTEGLPCNIKIAKNNAARTHACLIPWEELDELSARENAVTGRGVDYKQMDINNVLTLPAILKAGEKKGAPA